MLKDFILKTKAISDETRVRILKLLSIKELCVCEIMYILSINQSTTSMHLRILKASNLVNVHKKGTWAFYSLNNDTSNIEFIKLITMLLNNDPVIINDLKNLKKLKNTGTICKMNNWGVNE